jgi:phosphosulfolactate phosphohydrolase-like enzyme
MGRGSSEVVLPHRQSRPRLADLCHAHALAGAFTVIFYGLRNFCCKTVQLCATQRESEMTETPSVRNAAQAGEKGRKNSFFNYESPALTAELQSRTIRGLNHSIARRPTLKAGKPPKISDCELWIADLG